MAQPTPFLEWDRGRMFFVSPQALDGRLRRKPPGEHDWFFLLNEWYMPDHPPGIEAYHRLVHHGFDRIRILCNSADEKSWMISRFGFPADWLLPCPMQFCHGLTQSTQCIRPGDGAARRYDAVMNARSQDYKNRWAADRVTRIALIDFLASSPQRSCAWSNSGFLQLREIIPILQQSHCGLILSFVEGACLASLEYLLAGLPVVSTRSRGGRDQWYSEDNCIMVGPGVEQALEGRFEREQLQQEVVEAVELWKSRDANGLVDPQAISRGALARCESFARVFLGAIHDILEPGNCHDEEYSALAGDGTFGQLASRLIRDLKPYHEYGAYTA